MTKRPSGRVDPDRVKEQVRARYGAIATGSGCCGSSADKGACCDGEATALQLGYTVGELSHLPAGANLGLGCGNPVSLLALKPGDVALDLGSGAGVDCFLASRKVGPKGRVIGVDMTPEMLSRARTNARSGPYRNVEFRLGEIEHLPVADNTVDVVLSNCVINLAPDKEAVYREAFRVLRTGGRLAVSDVVATRRIPTRERADPTLWSSCSSGAIERDRLKTLLRRIGFQDVRVDLDPPPGAAPTLQGQASLGVLPAKIRALKPAPGPAPTSPVPASRAL